MESLRENRALLYSLLGSGGVVFALALGIIPEFAQQFEIIDFPSEVSILLVANFYFVRGGKDVSLWFQYCSFKMWWYSFVLNGEIGKKRLSFE